MKYQYLNIGCGSHAHPVWINIDMIAKTPTVRSHDLRKGLPYEDCSMEATYSSHVLEYLNQDDAKSYIAEQFRVLKPGGIIRLVVPDLEQKARLYLEYLEKAKQGKGAAEYDWMMIELLVQVVRRQNGGKMRKALVSEESPARNFIRERLGNNGEVHQWMYDTFSTKRILRNAEFVDEKICQAKESRIPYFDKFGLDTVGEDVRKAHSIFVEGIKPSIKS